MKRVLLLVFGILALSVSSQVVNNMVVFCNEPEPFTLILNGERINMEPQTRVRVEGLTLKKYTTKVIFKNPKLKEANTTITFFSSGYECSFNVRKVGKRKYKIEYLTDKPIEADNSQQNNPVPQNNNTQQPSNNNGNNYQGSETTSASQTLTAEPTNTLLTGPGVTNNAPVPSNGTFKCNSQLSDTQILSIINAVKELPNDQEKEAKALLMMEGACLTVNQLKQLLNSFFSENTKYNFARQVYERTKDNSEFVKLSETFIDVVVKDKFHKFVQSKK